jgi:N-acetylmuramate 1-kinase
MAEMGELETLAADGDDVRVAEYLRQRFGTRAAGVRVTPLAGDASTRKYSRVEDAGATWVLALYPAGFAPEESSYLALHRLLSDWGLPLPEIVDCDGPRGIVLLEDLGDCTLQTRLAVAPPRERESLYRQAIGGLVSMQLAAARSAGEAACFQLAFDVEKLTWELDFFVEHFLQGWRRCRLSAEDQGDLRDAFAGLCGQIAAWPRVLCHRDYHSRNLMWRSGRLYWVDFQDARMGPATYDLASLLRDSYVDLDEGFVAARVEEFRETLLPGESAVAFEGRFELASIQRNLKALGTFGYQAAVRGKTEYLQFVPRTLAHARRNLQRHEELAGITRVLARHLEEFRT